MTVNRISKWRVKKKNPAETESVRTIISCFRMGSKTDKNEKTDCFRNFRDKARKRNKKTVAEAYDTRMQ